MRYRPIQAAQRWRSGRVCRCVYPCVRVCLCVFFVVLGTQSSQLPVVSCARNLVANFGSYSCVLVLGLCECLLGVCQCVCVCVYPRAIVSLCSFFVVQPNSLHSCHSCAGMPSLANLMVESTLCFLVPVDVFFGFTARFIQSFFRHIYYFNNDMGASLCSPKPKLFSLHFLV